MSPTRTHLENVDDIYPLTPIQQGMLFHSITDDDSGVYVDQIVARIDGPVDAERLRAAWDVVVGRHAALRTAFLWDGLDEPLQVVRGKVELQWKQPSWSDEWTSFDAAEQRRRLDELLTADRAKGFDLASAPLLRLHLWRDDATGSRLVLTFHHLIVDGWSTRLLLDEAMTIHATDDLDDASLAKPMPFRDYVQWLTGREAVAAEQAWTTELAEFTTPTPIYPPTPPITAGRAGRQLDCELDRDVTDRARRLGAARGLTLNTIVQGAWALVLSRWSRSDDVVFGVTVSGRPPTLPGIEHAVGMFINTVPLRARLDTDANMGDWLRELQRSRLRLQDHDATSLADIQRWSDVDPGESLFDSILVFENYPIASIDRPGVGGISLTDLEFHEHSNYPLALLALPGERLRFTFVYDGARFDEAWIATIADALAAAVVQLVESVEQPLNRLSLLGSPDAERLRAWNDTVVPFPSRRCIHDLIEEAAARRPDHPAIISPAGQVTYAELDRRANGLAAQLLADGVEPGTRVGVKIERSAEMLVGVLGVLKAGAAYVPLDPTYPDARNQAIIDDAGLDIVVTATDLPPPMTDPPGVERSSSRPAYVIYTSGSTGRPKGVPVTHRNLVHSTTARSHHYGRGPERFLLLSSFAFDSSAVGIFWTLCTGGTLVLPAPGQEQEMEVLTELVEQHSVTHLLTLPSLYALLLDHGRHRLASLEVAVVAGEACSASTAAIHHDLLPTAELHNEYGPTEATVWSTVHRVEPADTRGPVPIGRPIVNTRTHVLDPQARPVPIGFPGELYLGGEGVTPGYLGRADLTEAAFVDVEVLGGVVERLYRTGDLACHRSDGALLYLGRADSQLKIRGHRIEAGEVEAALVELPGIVEAAVLGRETVPGRTQLVAYVAASAIDGTAHIRSALEQRLPEFMVPSTIVAMLALPRLPNGKIDTGALPEPRAASESRAAGVAPRTDDERTLAGLWSELLGVERVTIDDDFFALGGDSIVSIQLLSRARRAGLQLEPRDVADHPTLAGLAAAARRSATVAEEPGATAGVVPLAPIQRWFFDLDLAVPEHWNQSQLFEVPADLDVAAMRVAFEACVAHHPQLQARFERGPDGWRQWIPDRAGTAPFLEVTDETALYAIQSSFDLATTLPIAAALLRRDSESGLLLIAVHHLVIDLVSWTVLIDDLEAAYVGAVAGRAIGLPAPTPSYRRWVEQVDDERRRVPTSTSTLPVDFDGDGPGTEATTRTSSTSLTLDQTTSLLTDANVAYRTNPEDLLVAALGLAVADWTHNREMQLAIEGHGRPDDLDTSRTIGWFTDTSTAVLTFDPDADPGVAITAAKEQLRSERYSPDPTTPIGFNYLGRVARPSTGRLLMPRSGADETSRAHENRRTHLLDVVVAVRDDRLTIDVRYSSERHRDTTATSLTTGIARRLTELLEWCSNTDSAPLTPSDFPEAGLDQNELDAFLDDIL